MKVLGLVLGLLTTANVMAEGFSTTFEIEPNSVQNRDAESENFTDFDFYLKYNNELGHTFILRPEFRYSNDTEETVANNIRFRHKMTLAKFDDVSFASDFRMHFQGESTETKSLGQLNSFTFAPSFMISADAESSNFYFLVKPYLSKAFNDERYNKVTDEDTKAQSLVPNIDYNIYNLFLAGMTVNKFTIEVYYGYQMNWNSTGDQVDDGYELAEEITIAMNKNLSFLIGHSRTGDLYDTEGRSNGISFNSPDGDRYYGKMILNF